MLMTPVHRTSIAAGKSLCVFIASTIGGISAFIGMAAALPQLASSVGIDEGFSYQMTEYVLLFAVTITAVFAMTSILLIISTLSKDVMQASNIASVFLIVILFACMLSTADTFKDTVEGIGIWNAVIPAWNTSIVMGDIMKLDYSSMFVLISCGANLLFCVISMCFLGWCFKNERIVNG